MGAYYLNAFAFCEEDCREDWLAALERQREENVRLMAALADAEATLRANEATNLKRLAIAEARTEELLALALQAEMGEVADEFAPSDIAEDYPAPAAANGLACYRPPGRDAVPRDLIEQIAIDVSKQVSRYIQRMYPHAIKASSRNMPLSLRHFTFNNIMAALAGADEKEIKARLARRKKHRWKINAMWQDIRSKDGEERDRAPDCAAAAASEPRTKHEQSPDTPIWDLLYKFGFRAG